MADSKNSTSTLEAIVKAVLVDDVVHCKWLNTLSLLENVGARKISASQDSQMVTEEVLQHAWEEGRHAWYLKRQLQKLSASACPTYEPKYLLAPRRSFRYLHKLDVQVSRLVKSELELTGRQLRDACYLLVTYGIEVQADRLYRVYERLLRQAESPVTVRGIIAEEDAHLAQMSQQIEQQFDQPQLWITRVVDMEAAIFCRWVDQVTKELQVGSTTY